MVAERCRKTVDLAVADSWRWVFKVQERVERPGEQYTDRNVFRAVLVSEVKAPAARWWHVLVASPPEGRSRCWRINTLPQVARPRAGSQLSQPTPATACGPLRWS